MRALGIVLMSVTLPLAACSRAEDSDGDATAAEEATPGPTGRVTLSDSAVAAAGIQVEEVKNAAPETLLEALEVPGQVTFDSSRIAVISPRAPGRLESMEALPGERVGNADSTAFVSSPDYLAAQNDLLQALRRSDLLEGTDEAENARAMVEAARQRLLLIGATSGDVERLLTGGEPSLLLPLRPPFAGTVLEALAEPGVALQPGEPVYRIADLRAMHVVAQVPEEALAQVRPGLRAEVSVIAYRGRIFVGRIERILDQLDPQTRSARVVVGLSNPDRSLKAGMFATVRIEGVRADVVPTQEVTSGGRSPVRAYLVPTGAVLTDGEERFVFLEVNSRTFERRDVEVAPEPAGSAPTDRVRVTSGLSAGDRVVVAGAIVLRSELAKGSLVDQD